MSQPERLGQGSGPGAGQAQPAMRQDSPGAIVSHVRAATGGNGDRRRVHDAYGALRRLTRRGRMDWRTREALAFDATIEALATYAGDLWNTSLRLRVLAREIAIWAIVTATADGYVLAEGVLRSDGRPQPVLDRRESWGKTLRETIDEFENRVQAAKPDAGPLLGAAEFHALARALESESQITREEKGS